MNQTYNENEFLNYFQQIYVINLLEREDRKKEITEQLTSIGLTPAQHNRIRFFEAIIPLTPGEFESKGARGCFDSHLSVLKKAKEQKLSRVLILEDDVNFTSNFKKVIGATLKQLNTVEWDIFYGDYKLLITQPLGSDSNSIKKIEANDALTCANFIAFQGETITKMIDFLVAIKSRKAGDPAGGAMHVDGAYNFFRQNNSECLAYISTKKLGYQRSSKSNITPSLRHKASDYFNSLIQSVSKLMSQ